MPDIADLFATLETSKDDYIKIKQIEDKTGAKMGPHLVKLPKGSVPRYISLTPYQQFCWKTLGRAVKIKAKPNAALEDALIKAHMKIRPEEYTAVVWMNTIFAGIGGAIAGIIIGLLLFSILGLLIAIALVAMVPIMTYFISGAMPSSRAKSRESDIDKKLNSAMSFISAMASANVNIDVIFKELSRQEIYGEVREEAEWITRDTELLGLDILTAIKEAADRTPSQKFRDFLQGVITTSTSGGQLKPYFLVKAEQYEKENKLEMRSRMETLGMLAESFVTVGVAFPLFLVIIMAIMSVVSKNAGGTIMLLYAVVLGMIPGVQFAFIFGLLAVGGSED